MSAMGTTIVEGSGSMLPQKIWNVEPLKSQKMLPIFSVIGKKAHNFLNFLAFVFYFLHEIQACHGMIRPVMLCTKLL